MIQVQGRPILEYIIEGLRDNTSIREFFLITGYRGDIIREHFGNGDKWNVTIGYGHQEILDGTGKAPELAKAWLSGSSFLLSYGDILVNPENYGRMEEAFREDGLLTVRRNEELTKGGAVTVDSNFFVTDLVEKPDPDTVHTPWYNAGIYVFTEELFKYTGKLKKSPRGEFELTDAIRQMAHAGLKIKALELDGAWADVRDPEVLAELNRQEDSGS